MLMTAERCWALPSAGQRRRAVLPLPFLAVTRELLSCGVTASRRGTCPPGSPLLCSELKFQVTAQWRPLWPQAPVVPRFIMASFQMIISEFCGPHSAVSWCRLTALGSRPPSCPAPLAPDLKDHLRLFWQWTRPAPHGRRRRLFFCLHWVFWGIPVARCGIILFISRHNINNRICPPPQPQTSLQLVLCPLPLVGLLIQLWDIDFPLKKSSGSQLNSQHFLAILFA